MGARIPLAFGLALILGAAPAIADEAPFETQNRRFLQLIDRLRDADEWKTRLEAAVALGRSRDLRAREALTRALSDPHYAVRAAVIRALSRTQDVRIIAPLIDALADDEPFVRREALRALDAFALPLARPYLIRALSRHADGRVRLGAAERLAESSHPDALSALLDATGDESEISRFAISAIRARPEKEATPILLRGLSHSDYRVQIASIQALADLASRDGAEPIIELLDSNVPEVKRAAAQAVAALAPNIDPQKYFVAARRSKNIFTRARALRVVGLIGGPKATPIIRNALDDADVLVRGAAVSAIAGMGDRGALPKLVVMRKSEDNARIISLLRRTIYELERAPQLRSGEDVQVGRAKRSNPSK